MPGVSSVLVGNALRAAVLTGKMIGGKGCLISAIVVVTLLIGKSAKNAYNSNIPRNSYSSLGVTAPKYGVASITVVR